MTTRDVIDMTAARLRRQGREPQWSDLAQALAVHLVDICNSKGQMALARRVKALEDELRIHNLKTLAERGDA